MSTAVEEWFGSDFTSLHPQLQRLHRHGGVLLGEVNVSFGSGFSGVLGRRIATRLGVPATAGPHRLQVTIYSADRVLHWNRRFDDSSEFPSRFEPVGSYPSGHWIERSGALSLTLGVRIINGGWHWEHRATRLRGVPLPKGLLPQTIASKDVIGDAYRFSVEVRAPVLGILLCYRGDLKLLASV